MAENNLSEFIRLLENTTITTKITDDEQLQKSDFESLKNHSNEYDSILKNYSKHVEKTLKEKTTMKKCFFWLSFIIMSLSVISILICSSYMLYHIHSGKIDIGNYILPAISSLISFLTVFIIIPKIIAKYLFNSKEDSAMRGIIADIQKYDKYIRDKYKKNK